MKKMNGYINTLLVSTCCIGFIQGQGAIINEMSNGVSGSQEFIELLVIGSASNPTGNVDLSGWILDDNNGDFEATGAGVGIASGHIRIAGGCLTSVPPGTLIVLYNAPDVVLTPDATDNDNDCVYFLPDSSSCLEDCNTGPSPTNSSYTIGCTYGPANWTVMTLRNGGDAVQLRDPSFNFFHGFSYGDVTIPSVPNFPASLGGTAAFAITGSGSGSEFIYNDGNFTNASNFSRQAASNQTPGLPNNANNRYVINQIRNGTFDYTNLNAIGNSGSAASLSSCATLLPLKLVHFLAMKTTKGIKLTWEVALKNEPNFSFDLEQSENGVNFQLAASVIGDPMSTHYETILNAPLSTSYYRLKIYLSSGEVIYGPVRAISVFSKEDFIKIYPNPAVNRLFVETNTDLDLVNELLIFNLLGQKVFDQTIEGMERLMSIDISNLEQGSYLLMFKNEQQSLVRAFTK